MLENEELDWEVESVVAEEVLEVVPLEELVVLGGTEELLDDDEDEDEVGVDTVLVEADDEVVEGTGVGDAGVLLVGEEEGTEIAKEVVVGTTLQNDVLA